MKEERLKRLEWTAKKILPEIIFEEIEDVEKIFWIITITKIKISQDLSYLDIYVSSFQNIDLLTKTLAKHAYQIQKKFNKKITLLKTPKFRFRYDDSWEKFTKIDNLLKKIQIEKK